MLTDPAMPIHLDVLGRLHIMLGGFAVLAGASLMILAGGTRLALLELGSLALLEDAAASAVAKACIAAGSPGLAAAFCKPPTAWLRA